MNAFYNHGQDIADDALDGLVASRGGEIRRLSRDEAGANRIVLRSAVNPNKVAVISGGGAGHEPWSTGLVGSGMLTAAVSGGVYASPSAGSILMCIRAVNVKSVLLLVSNYTGDTLNFRMAAQSARALGITVETVLVKDDVSIHQSNDADSSRRRRGIAGAGIVHKVAGYYAELGRDLDTVRRMAQLAADSVYSSGVARTVCTIPGASVKKERIPSGSVEVGIGIHGEQGRETVELQSSYSIVERVCGLVEKHVDANWEYKYAGLFNNLGGMSNLEAFVAFNDFTKMDMFKRCVKYVAGPATACSSLDMAGFSISMVKLDADGYILQALMERTELFPKFIPSSSQPTSIEFETKEAASAVIPVSENDAVRSKLVEVLDCCERMRAVCNELDSISGDADTGDTIARAAGAVRIQLNSNSLPLNDTVLLVGRIGEIAGSAAGGTLGGVISVFLREISLTEEETENWGYKLERGLKVVCDALQVQPGDRTVIDALMPAIEALKDTCDMKEAAKAARKGADSTKNMRAKAGRAVNVPQEALSGMIDPGAEAAARIFEQLAL